MRNFQLFAHLLNSYSHKNKVQCWRCGMHLSFPRQWRCKLEAETDGRWRSWIPYYHKISKQMAGRQFNKLIIDMKILTAWLIYLSSNFAWVPWWSSSAVAMQEVDRFATNHKKQIGKLEIHFATIAYWAGKCYGNEVSVPVHRLSACAPVGCLPNKNWKLFGIMHFAAGCTHGVPCALLSATFTRHLQLLQKICSQFQKAQKKPIWKENCCCRDSKRKTQQKNRTESAFFFLPC